MKQEKSDKLRGLGWADNFSVWKMDGLTRLGQRILPRGYWGCDVNSGSSSVALTFDDGPCPDTTPYLLELLEQVEVRATFFVIGSHVSRHERLLDQIHRAGHTVASHSFHHHFMPALSTRSLEKEIDRTNHAIREVTGAAPELFRPPYGVMDERLGKCLAERRMLPVYWGVVPEDWHGPGAASVINRTMTRLRPGSLIVLHEMPRIAKQTLAAAKEIIVKAKQTGYDFVSVPDLIASGGP
jgi:peptidoglycan/xylan/chitin deacetylase (PgdA/CDA1 family)